ncbi:MAG: hypothetical protein ACJAYK_000800 [Crocinitomicaceae bacterium]|jgi:hypothetical protein
MTSIGSHCLDINIPDLPTELNSPEIQNAIANAIEPKTALKKEPISGDNSTNTAAQNGKPTMAVAVAMDNNAGNKIKIAEIMTARKTIIEAAIKIINNDGKIQFKNSSILKSPSI